MRIVATHAPQAPVTPQERTRARTGLRLYAVGMGLAIWSLGIMAQLFNLQIQRHAKLQTEARRQSERTITVRARRGAIRDRSGRPLAVSVEAQSIHADPSAISDPKSTARALGRALSLDAAEQRELASILSSDRSFVWVKRQVDGQIAQAVKDLQLEGIGFEVESRRYYPKRELLAPVLGHVGLDSEGLAGMEYAFEDDLKGRAAQVQLRLDARRRPIGEVQKPSTEGRTLVLTIDERIQYITEQALESSIASTRSVAGQAIVMDPHTGEILAMATLPSFNPNKYAAYPVRHRANHTVVSAFEPGSVFKIITAAAGLQENVVSPSEVLDCGNGKIDIAGTIINDHHPYNRLTFEDVMAKSSDIGVIRVAQRLGRDQFYGYMRAFGIGEKTGSGLPGESSGLLQPPSKWSALSLPTMSFGQEVAVTGLQMTAAAAVIANGGYWVRPQIVRRIEEPNGDVVKEMAPVAERKVIDSATADRVMSLLRRVVTLGTGRRAVIAGFDVAGKTGTAQKVDATGRYSMVDHVASFVGFVPASRPSVVILVSLDKPQGDANEGGDVAAPLFAKIGTEAMRLLAVPPDDVTRSMRIASDELSDTSPALFVSETTLPSTRGAEPPLSENLSVMPNLTGLSAREAAAQVARRGLVVELQGRGSVVAQSPVAGAPVQRGATSLLRLGVPSSPQPPAVAPVEVAPPSRVSRTRVSRQR